jgi:cysteinyl-tRNA synthetase
MSFVARQIAFAFARRRLICGLQMALKLFNTLTRSVQEFVPLDPQRKKAGMYCCGPTVYDFAHIGNWRTFVFADLVRRTLEFSGYEVTHVMNITDVEDKIIKRVREQKTTLREFTGKFETAFLDDLKALGCREPHVKPRATEHIAEIIALIEKLVARGVAYKAADGSVYFSIEKYRGCGCCYGQLLKLNLDEMRAGERVASDEYEKESVADFALWKARVPDDGDVFWPSPFGEGRPGWHIECSAMSIKALGETFDLHLGGEDLKFPHHEDEIAQSEGATGKPFVKFWLHGAHLLVEGKKMSKSLGNFFTLRDLLAKGFTGREVRYLLLTAHYRETFNFTLDGLHGAKTGLARIDECVGKLRELGRGALPRVQAGPQVSPTNLVGQFSAALADDLNISAAWASVFEWVRETNKRIAENSLDADQAAVALAAWEKVDSVLGVGVKAEAEIPAEISALAAARTEAKKAKDFKRADAIRDELKAKGWLVEDTPKGVKLKKI